MPIELPLPTSLKRARWKVKILEKETVEPPHLSILRRDETWRIDLRTGEFMNDVPEPAKIPKQLLALIRNNWEWLCDQWDSKYPDNPVLNAEDRQDGNKHNPADAK